MTPNVQTLERFFAAINRYDMPAILGEFDPEVVRIEPAGYATAGTHRGLAELEAHLRQGLDTWAEGSCDPERFLEHGDKVVVYLHARVRLKDKTDWIDGRFADGFVLRDGRITEYRTFWERPQALAWAGIDDPAVG